MLTAVTMDASQSRVQLAVGRTDSGPRLQRQIRRRKAATVNNVGVCPLAPSETIRAGCLVSVLENLKENTPKATHFSHILSLTTFIPS